MGGKAASLTIAQDRGPAIRFLVESALREVMSDKQKTSPRTHDEWVAHLSAALISGSDAPHHAVIAQLMSRGVTRTRLLSDYVPAAARHIGELWLRDKASFVDVTVGASRLQQMFRHGADSHSADGGPGRCRGGSIPLGQTVLMVVPRFEDHALGAFVVAEDLRRHGLWVHMGIHLDGMALADMMREGHFSMVCLTLATANSIEKAAQMVNLVRATTKRMPPVVIGGRAVGLVPDAARRVGADHAAGSAREAIEKCGLATLAPSSMSDDPC